MLIALVAGIGALVLLVVIVALVATPSPAKSCAPPECVPKPPTGPRVEGDHTFTSSQYKFSVDYFDVNVVSQEVETAPDGITLSYPDLKGGPASLQIVGAPSEGMSAQEVVESVVSGNFAGAEQAYVLPNASVGYRPGYGAVYDLYPQSTNGSSEHDRVIVLASVQDDLAVVAVAGGPYYEFTPDGINVGHPSAANTLVALFADDPINTVRWPGEPPR